MENENKKKGLQCVHFVICDPRREYARNLLHILREKLPETDSFFLFHGTDGLKEHFENHPVQVFFLAEEIAEQGFLDLPAERIYVLTEDQEEPLYRGVRTMFRYQSADQIVKRIQSEDQEQPYTEIRERPQESFGTGIIGIYSPVHRIGKTTFALEMGKQLAEKHPVLYLNLEGYSGRGYYFGDSKEKDLGKLMYDLKQERANLEFQVSIMAEREGGPDYIMPMENELDLRSVKGEEWIRLLDMISKKCIYETILLDLGDGVQDLYELLRRCDKVYTPYIEEGIALAKLHQYESNLRKSGYEDVLEHTIRRRFSKQ